MNMYYWCYIRKSGFQFQNSRPGPGFTTHFTNTPPHNRWVTNWSQRRITERRLHVCVKFSKMSILNRLNKGLLVVSTTGLAVIFGMNSSMGFKFHSKDITHVSNFLIPRCLLLDSILQHVRTMYYLTLSSWLTHIHEFSVRFKSSSANVSVSKMIMFIQMTPVTAILFT